MYAYIRRLSCLSRQMAGNTHSYYRLPNQTCQDAVQAENPRLERRYLSARVWLASFVSYFTEPKRKKRGVDDMIAEDTVCLKDFTKGNAAGGNGAYPLYLYSIDNR